MQSTVDREKKQDGVRQMNPSEVKFKPAGLPPNDAPLPARLRRYFRLNDTAGVALLEKGQLWFSSIRYFNDPFDCLPRYDVLARNEFESRVRINHAFLEPGVFPDFNSYRKMMESMLPQIERDARLVYPQKFRHNLAEVFGVVCFCAGDETSPLMWSHYADQHRGFVVEIETPNELWYDALARVRYSNERVHVDRIDPAVVCTKSRHWEYEVEHRLIVPLDQLEVAMDESRTRHFAMLEPRFIRRVYLGWLWTQGATSHPIKAIRLLEATLRLNHVEVVQMEPSASDFSLLQRPIDRKEVVERLQFLQAAPPPGTK